MAKEIESLLEEEIKNGFQALDEIEPGTKEYNSALADLERLYKLKIEETKTRNDHQEKIQRRRLERELKARDDELKMKEIEEKSKDRKANVGLGLIGIAVPTVFNSVWMKKGFKFETEGTYTSQTFRWLTQQFGKLKK